MISVCYWNNRELSFQKGDIIFVRRQIDKNWYEGEHNAMVGIFPVNYVEVKWFDLISCRLVDDALIIQYN